MRLALSLTLLLSACAEPADTSRDAGSTRADADLPVTGCPGERPADDEACVQGDGWRDCGGTGAARFACEPGTYVCAWFDGGCVPTSWVPSPCAADELCCVDDWPYASGALDAYDQAATAFHVQLMGVERPDRAALSRVAVVLDPALSAGSTLTLTCDRPDPLCASLGRPDAPPPVAQIDGTDDTVTLSAFPAGGLGTSPRLLVEVDPSDPRRASACIAQTTDGVVLACGAIDPPRCADSGTLTLSAMPAPRSGPASVAARLVARFGDLEVTLELPR